MNQEMSHGISDPPGLPRTSARTLHSLSNFLSGSLGIV
jgi:hypothetical protein